jgi:protein involved in polysaccharide export with SLBB domain
MHELKRLLVVCLLSVYLTVTSAMPVLAEQGAPDDAAGAAQEVQQTDSGTAQAIKDALSKGDIQGAKGLYQNFKKNQAENQARSAATITAAAAADAPLSAATTTADAQLKLSLLEQKLSGDLRQFGYELFNRTVSTFTAPLSIPVGSDYVLGPGDQFTITVWGTTEGIYNLKISKEGEITLPKVGVVSIAGTRFGDLEKVLKRQLSKYYSDFNLSVAMGGLKSLTVYVVGEVAKPGSYSLSSLSTVYGALFAAGGPTKLGSLRTIQVLRSGKVVKTLDLYDFLLKGDRSQDLKLQNEDSVFVPLIGPVAGIAGTVYRPAIYELKGTESIDDVIAMAGGIMPIALGGRLQLTRYDAHQKKVIIDITLPAQPASSSKSTVPKVKEFGEKVLNMDVIAVSPVYENVWETVEIRGAVEHPGVVQWRPDLTVREVVQHAAVLPKTDLKRADVVRISKDMIEKKIIPIDLGKLLAGDETQNILLESKDRIEIFTVDQNPQNLWETVSLNGSVRNPGTYQWRPDLKVREIIVEGQLLPKADLKRADVIRLNKDMQDRTVLPVDLEKLMAGDETQNLVLQVQDEIRVYSSYKATEKVTVSGELVRTGDFEISKGERLSDLLRRAGGFSVEAYPYGAVLRRKDVRNEQTKYLKTMIARTQGQIARVAATKTSSAISPEEQSAAKAEMTMSQSLLDSIRTLQEQSDGRVVISVSENIDAWAGSKYDVLLQDGDTLVIPKRPQDVRILGEVHSAGAQIFLPDMTIKDYLDHSGGVTKNADKGEIFVVQADGYSYSSDSPSVSSFDKMKLHAGDTIIVPENVDRGEGLRTAKDILDMLFKTAVIAATLKFLF